MAGKAFRSCGLALTFTQFIDGVFVGATQPPDAVDVQVADCRFGFLVEIGGVDPGYVLFVFQIFQPCVDTPVVFMRHECLQLDAI